ncbi:MAG: N-acetylmuramoyl-L-alanine amidase, partial [Xanthobacteraceae bacterium]
MAGRANHYLSWGVALFAGIALACGATASFAAGDTGVTQPVAAEPFPIASDVRVAGDSKQTRFVLDLDRKIDLRAFVLGNPDRVVIDIPQVTFKLPDHAGQHGRGLIKAFRYGLVMPGGSRLVFDLAGPAKIEKAYVLDAANGQPPRLIVELAATDRAAFNKSLAKDTATEAPPSAPPATVTADAGEGAERLDTRPVVVIDPGHGGIDNGTQAASGETEKAIVLAFSLALRDRIGESGKYRVVLTRDDDTFIPLGDRVKIARAQNASLFVSIHADALPRREGDAQGATIYTLSDKASDAEAERLAELENKADAIGGVNLTEEPTEVADILIDLAQRETRTFSSRFAHTLMG